MKAIHPQWYEEAVVKCACGNTFSIGATQPSIEVEVCSHCHPFYTGQMRFTGAAGRVDAFLEKRKHASKNTLSKKERRKIKRLKKIKEEMEKPDTLEELRKAKKR